MFYNLLLITYVNIIFFVGWLLKFFKINMAPTSLIWSQLPFKENFPLNNNDFSLKMFIKYETTWSIMISNKITTIWYVL